MVEEKDAELNEKRMREAEVNANKTSLVIHCFSWILKYDLKTPYMRNKKYLVLSPDFFLISNNQKTNCDIYYIGSHELVMIKT